MALANIKKIQLIGISKHLDKVLETIQKAGVVEINQANPEETQTSEIQKTSKKLQEVELKHANLEFAIKLLGPLGKKESIFNPLSLTHDQIVERAKAFDHQKVIDECIELEDQIVKAKNNINSAENEIATYSALKKVEVSLENFEGTESSSALLISMSESDAMEANMALSRLSKLMHVKEIHSAGKQSYLLIVFVKELESEIKELLSDFKYSEIEAPNLKGTYKSLTEKAEKELHENQKQLNKLENKLQKLASNLEDLKVAYDYINWEKEKLQQFEKISNTEKSFLINAWVPGHHIETLNQELEKITKEFAIQEIPLKESEVPPVILKNSNFLLPFEAVTGVYGLPLHNEPDPTPYLSAFFILFFALCLTDAGYGIVMAAVMALGLKYLKLAPGMRKLVKLLMYGGIVTFVIGALFGGWFGLTADQVPEVLTYVNDEGTRQFILQKFNAIEDPITVLILALALGFIQILFGTFIKLFHGLKHGNKKDAILDTGTWAFMLTGIGVFVLAATEVIPTVFTEIAKWWVILAAVILVLTQGREKKGIFAKLFSGTLSLYNLVGYLSDILSYSRLLALGLATAIIALAVNVIASLANGLPYVGWLLMILIFVGGHIFNLVINSLGSFIHSGRLQFVEFFGKFMEGGGNTFKPFSKKTQYTYVEEETTNK